MVPAPDAVQMPVVSALQLSQGPVHVVLQQTPSAQKLEAHSPGAVQRSPSSRRGMHCPSAVSQNAFARQSLLVVQPVRHAVPAQDEKPQDWSTSVHWPAPLHWRLMSGESAVVQNDAPQDVPCAPNAHLPAPSQDAPHGGVPVHSFAGSSPAATNAQVPMLPGRSHDSHVPPHAVSQHTPSAQKLEAHAVPLPHALPLGRRSSQPPSAPQRPVAEQSDGSAQDVLHAPSSQPYGAQDRVLCPHWPAPLHTADWMDAPTQRLSPQDFSAAG